MCFHGSIHTSVQVSKVCIEFQAAKSQVQRYDLASDNAVSTAKNGGRMSSPRTHKRDSILGEGEWDGGKRRDELSGIGLEVELGEEMSVVCCFDSSARG